MAERALSLHMTEGSPVFMTGLAVGDALVIESNLSPTYPGCGVAQRAVPGIVIGRALALVAGLAFG
jgi:hypothetical protein